MRPDYQILLKSPPPLTLVAGCVPVRIQRQLTPTSASTACVCSARAYRSLFLTNPTDQYDLRVRACSSSSDTRSKTLPVELLISSRAAQQPRTLTAPRGVEVHACAHCTSEVPRYKLLYSSFVTSAKGLSTLGTFLFSGAHGRRNFFSRSGGLATAAIFHSTNSEIKRKTFFY